MLIRVYKVAELWKQLKKMLKKCSPKNHFILDTNIFKTIKKGDDYKIGCEFIFNLFDSYHESFFKQIHDKKI